MTYASSSWRVTWLALGVCLSSVSCGVSASSGTDNLATELDGGSDPNASPPIPAQGPFDLVFTAVYENTPSEPYGFGPDAPETHIRLDLVAEGNESKALLTPLFLEPVEMVVTVTPGWATLNGSVLIGSESDCGGSPTGMTWEEIRFPIDSGGAPVGSFEASGTALYIPPKVGGGVKAVKGEGTILPDTRPPAFTVGPSTYHDGSLPWDPIEVIASEPLSNPVWPQALAVAVPNPPPFAAVSENVPGAPLGTQRATARLTDWNGLGSAVMVDAMPVADGSGNVSMPWSGTLGLIDVGAPADRLRFIRYMPVSAWRGGWPSRPFRRSACATVSTPQAWCYHRRRPVQMSVFRS